MSNWWTLHFDRHMRVLLDAEMAVRVVCSRPAPRGQTWAAILHRAAQRLENGVAAPAAVATGTKARCIAGAWPPKAGGGAGEIVGERQDLEGGPS